MALTNFKNGQVLTETELNNIVTEVNSKAPNTKATTSTDGLMSKEDKKKIDGLKNYTHPINHEATIITETEEKRFVSDAEKSKWNNKADNTKVSIEQDGLMSKEDKSKIDGIEANANNYTHPSNSGNKHIPAGGSEGQILVWSEDGTAVWGNDNNTTYSAATESALGLVKKMPTQADSTAIDVAGLVADFNALLAKLKSAGLMSLEGR